MIYNIILYINCGRFWSERRCAGSDVVTSVFVVIFSFSLSSSLLSVLLLLLTCPARQELFCISVQSSHRPVNNSTVFERADFAFYLIEEFWRFLS